MKRKQTQTERDLEGLAAKKEREGIRRDGSHVMVGTPSPLSDNFVPSGSSVPDFVEEESSAAYSHDPILLSEFRSKRPTDKRVERLESKYDKLVHSILERDERTETRRLDARTKAIIAICGVLGGGVLGKILHWLGVF